MIVQSLIGGFSAVSIPIAFDAQSYWAIWSSNTLTVSHTTTGLNRILLVAVSINNSWTTGIWCTYGWVAMTEISAVGYQQSTPWNAASFYVYSIINPTIWTNNIVLTASSSSFQLWLIWTSYTWTNQTTQPDVVGSTSQSNATSITKSVTVVSSNCWQWGATNNVASITNETTWTLTGNLTSFRQSSGNKWLVVADSNSVIGTGAQSTGFSYSSSILESHISLAIKPA